jgi:hypothetical protein
MVFEDAVADFSSEDDIVDVDDPEPMNVHDPTAVSLCSGESIADAEDITERNASDLAVFSLPMCDRDDNMDAPDDYEEVLSLCSNDSWTEHDKELESKQYAHMAVDFAKNTVRRACDLDDSEDEEEPTQQPQEQSVEALRLRCQSTLLSAMKMKASETERLRQQMAQKLRTADSAGRVLEVVSAIKEKAAEQQAEERRLAARQQLLSAMTMKASETEWLRQQMAQKLRTADSAGRFSEVVAAIGEKAAEQQAEKLRQVACQQLQSASASAKLAERLQGIAKAQDELRLRARRGLMSADASERLSSMLQKEAKAQELDVKETVVTSFVPDASDAAFISKSGDEAELVGDDELSFLRERASASLVVLLGDALETASADSDVVPAAAKEITPTEVVKPSALALPVPQLAAEWDVIESARLSAGPATPSGSRKLQSSKSKRRVIGGVVREPAPQMQMQEERSKVPVTPSSSGSKLRDITSISFRMDAEETGLPTSRSRPSSLTRGYDALGGCDFYSMQDKEDTFTPRLSAPHVLNEVRPPSRSHSASALMMDLGADAPFLPSKSFTLAGGASPTSSCKRSTSQGALLKVSKPGHDSFLPAISAGKATMPAIKPLSFQTSPGGAVSWNMGPTSSRRSNLLGATGSSPLFF